MGIVMIKCPNTGVAIPTGITTARSSFDRSPVFFGCTQCPICQTNHEWFVRDAWLHEELDQSRSASPYN